MRILYNFIVVSENIMGKEKWGDLCVDERKKLRWFLMERTMCVSTWNGLLWLRIE
jgi:hypothetical protein